MLCCIVPFIKKRISQVLHSSGCSKGVLCFSRTAFAFNSFVKLIMYFLFGMSALVKSVVFPRVNCVKLGENSVSSQSGQHMVKICTRT